MSVEKALLESKVRGLNPARAVCVEPSTSVARAVELMAEHKTGCIVVVERGRAAGIFTDRDVLNKIAGTSVSLDSPVSLFMTEGPKTISGDASLSDAIILMDRGGYRHLPLVNKLGQVEAIISVQHIVKFLAELFPTEVLNLPPHPHQYMATREGG